ncbi:VOC family protein [Streptomyces sp. NPDC051776]|uniref:VOC family protein n=1 Tax=Streptomyces sp. NPDC051776 TaxID=3155414 RepID=UPI003433FF69
MPVTTRAIQGAPCWVSLMAHDLEASRAYYASVLGWDYKPGFQGQGNYSIALAHGTPVAGLGTGGRVVGFPVSWTPYFAADSADRAAERVRERVATVAVGPLEFGKGRLVVAADPEDAVFGIWQGEIDPDWRVGWGTGAPARLELRTRDPFASALFYGGVFDWDAPGADHIDVRYEDERVVLRIAGHAVADLRGGGEEAAPDPHMRPQWHVYFSVDDVEAAVRKGVEAGGTIVCPPSASHFGPVASLRDPEGGLFHVTRADD